MPVSAASGSLTQRPQWRALAEHRARTADRQLRELFGADPGRGERLVAEAAGLCLDYSNDQWGVEFGKVLAQRTAGEIASPVDPALAHDSSTNALIRRYRRLRGRRR